MVEMKQDRAMRYWLLMTPAERDYDRFVARVVPYGASWAPETSWGREQRIAFEDHLNDGCSGCSCHISPPCYHCENNHDETGSEAG